MYDLHTAPEPSTTQRMPQRPRSRKMASGFKDSKFSGQRFATEGRARVLSCRLGHKVLCCRMRLDLFGSAPKLCEILTLPPLQNP